MSACSVVRRLLERSSSSRAVRPSKMSACSVVRRLLERLRFTQGGEAIEEVRMRRRLVGVREIEVFQGGEAVEDVRVQTRRLV